MSLGDHFKDILSIKDYERVFKTELLGFINPNKSHILTPQLQPK